MWVTYLCSFSFLVISWLVFSSFISFSFSLSHSLSLALFLTLSLSRSHSHHRSLRFSSLLSHTVERILRNLERRRCTTTNDRGIGNLLSLHACVIAASFGNDLWSDCFHVGVLALQDPGSTVVAWSALPICRLLARLEPNDELFFFFSFFPFCSCTRERNSRFGRDSRAKILGRM